MQSAANMKEEIPMFKKFIALFLVVMLALSLLTACGQTT